MQGYIRGGQTPGSRETSRIEWAMFRRNEDVVTFLTHEQSTRPRPTAQDQTSKLAGCRGPPDLLGLVGEPISGKQLGCDQTKHIEPMGSPGGMAQLGVYLYVVGIYVIRGDEQVKSSDGHLRRSLQYSRSIIVVCFTIGVRHPPNQRQEPVQVLHAFSKRGSECHLFSMPALEGAYPCGPLFRLILFWGTNTVYIKFGQRLSVYLLCRTKGGQMFG